MGFSRSTLVVAILISMGTAMEARADPPAWVLQAATIEVGSMTLAGFAAFSNFELKRFRDPGNEDASVVDYKGNAQEIRRTILNANAIGFYASIVRIKYPTEMLVTTKPRRFVGPGQIREVVLKEHPLNGFQWYGALNEVSDQVASRLRNEKPHFFCKEPYRGCCSDFWWLSYDKGVREVELGALCKTPAIPESQYQQLVEKAKKLPNVYRISESND